MYFEAEIKRKKYKVEVNESKTHWHVNLQAVGEKLETYEISKIDYTKFDDAISFLFTGKSYMMDVVGNQGGYTIFTGNSYRNVVIHNDESLLHESLKSGSNMADSSKLAAGMPGKISKIFVKPGQRLTKGKPILIMEAMKMENEMRASHDCVIKDIHVAEGASVESGAVLVTFETN
jgi:acetyl/propionyl-CoA carboxylase alpha subunit